jgi:hypothetical protein
MLIQSPVWICWLLRREERKGALKRWFWMIMLATAELYGGNVGPFSIYQHSLFCLPTHFEL